MAAVIHVIQSEARDLLFEQERSRFLGLSPRNDISCCNWV